MDGMWNINLIWQFVRATRNAKKRVKVNGQRQYDQKEREWEIRERER